MKAVTKKGLCSACSKPAEVTLTKNTTGKGSKWKCHNCINKSVFFKLKVKK